jgi:hypothetical protein
MNVIINDSFVKMNGCQNGKKICDCVLDIDEKGLMYYKYVSNCDVVIPAFTDYGDLVVSAPFKFDVPQGCRKMVFPNLYDDKVKFIRPSVLAMPAEATPKFDFKNGTHEPWVIPRNTVVATEYVYRLNDE